MIILYSDKLQLRHHIYLLPNAFNANYPTDALGFFLGNLTLICEALLSQCAEYIYCSLQVSSEHVTITCWIRQLPKSLSQAHGCICIKCWRRDLEKTINVMRFIV